ncbi:MAG: glycosyltransferase family 4 protein [Candidatus Poribacteria bacterium]
MIINYIILSVLSFLITFIITPVIRKTAVTNNALDIPCDRKIHKIPLPRLGGIAIAIAFFFSLSVGYILFRPDKNSEIEALAGISIGASIITFIGIWDDIRGLNAEKKSLGQLATALSILPFGFIINQVNVPFLGVINIGNPLGALLTIFWVIGIINAINFIDGIDGLAGTVTLFILFALSIISYIFGQTQMIIISIVLAGAVLGFLKYNIHKASIFMGDSGAMLLGFATSTVTIKVLFQNSDIVSSSMIPILIFGLPIVDATWGILRRLRRKKSPFSADLGHLHHRLISLGLSQDKVLLILGLIGLFSTSVGIIIVLLKSEILSVILCGFMLAIALSMVIFLGRISPISEQCQENLESHSKTSEVVS